MFSFALKTNLKFFLFRKGKFKTASKFISTVNVSAHGVPTGGNRELMTLANAAIQSLITGSLAVGNGTIGFTAHGIVGQRTIDHEPSLRPRL